MLRLTIAAMLAAVQIVPAQAQAQSSGLDDVPSSELIAELQYLLPLQFESSLGNSIEPIMDAIGLAVRCDEGDQDAATEVLREFISTTRATGFPDRFMPSQWMEIVATPCSELRAASVRLGIIFDREQRRVQIDDAIRARHDELDRRLLVPSDRSYSFKSLKDAFAEAADELADR